MQERLEKLEKIRREKGSPYSLHSFPKQAPIIKIKEDFSEGREVSVGGRLLSRREHGKSIFFDLGDFSGKIQCYLRKDLIGEDNFSFFKNLDIGDVLGVKGSLFKTKTAEVTVLVSEFKLLSKSLRPLPEKWHGLKDTELRFRKRYLDLIANPQVSSLFIKRSKLIGKIREFLDNQGFVEVETPFLHLIPGGASGKPFKTHHNALDIDIYLRIAPELYLKRLLVGGFDKIYELGRSFRNEGISLKHNPEFTMLEVYCAYQDYTFMMELTEKLIRALVKEVSPTGIINYQGFSINFNQKFKKISLASKLKEDLGIEFDAGPFEFIEKARQHFDIKDNLSRSQIIKLIEDLIEEKYFGGEPVFVTDFYTWMSPLAKTKKDNPNLVERFELFIGGIELANAYSELNDPIEQRERFLKQIDSEEISSKIDEDFIESLEYGMPPATGLGIGVDRLVMLLLNQPSLKEVIFFPLLKPQDK
ncbi:MAG: lysine--tRNA ligase [Candidatus Omnitrophica bacterium]|nr:lysine--tRNA ligase [Candidatus Omnitrophota bacterium]